MVSSYQTTKRAASIFVALLLVISLSMGMICPVYAAEAEGTPIALDKYSFLETICGMFNCFYFPEALSMSDLSTWNDVKSHETSFNLMLNMMSGYYLSFMTTEGFQSTDSTADDYVTPYLYYDITGTKVQSDSIYTKFVADGCLDFTSTLNENEYKLIQLAFNRVVKTMYDYNYNLLDYSIQELSASVPEIAMAVKAGSHSYYLYIGYNVPIYKYDDTKSANNNYYGASLSAMEQWITDYSASGFGVQNYVGMQFGGASGGTAAQTSELLNFEIFSNYLSNTDLSNSTVKIEYASSTTRSISIDTPICVHTFGYVGDSTDCTSTNMFDTYSTVKGVTKYAYVSPLIGYYQLDRQKIHNWGQDLIVGTSKAWDSYCHFDGESQGKYSVPTEETLNSLILTRVEEGDYKVIVDSVTGVNTGSDVIDTEQSPDFDYDRIEDSINNAIGGIINGGDYSSGNNAQNNLDDILGDYSDVENQLKDFTNLDSAIETFWNVNSLLENKTNIATVSTYFMTIWDSFGPWGICFSLALALGLAAFLLKI